MRHLVGYDRFASHAAYAQLTRVYRLARLHVNFFQPVQKLVTKTRAGTRTRRLYDRAQTPYQRLCATGVLPPATRDELEALSSSGQHAVQVWVRSAGSTAPYEAWLGTGYFSISP